MPSPMMVRLPDLVDMQPQNVFMTDMMTVVAPGATPERNLLSLYP